MRTRFFRITINRLATKTDLKGRNNTLPSLYLGSVRRAFQHHVHRLPWGQLHPQWLQFKHRKPGLRLWVGAPVLCLGTAGGGGLGLTKWGEAFGHPVKLMGATPTVGDFEAIAARVQAREHSKKVYLERMAILLS